MKTIPLSTTFLVRLMSLSLALLAGGCGIYAVKDIRIQVYPVAARTKTPPTDSQKAMMEESVLFIGSVIHSNKLTLTHDFDQPWNQTREQYYEETNHFIDLRCEVYIVPRKGWVRIDVSQCSSLYYGFSGPLEFRAMYRDLATNMVQHFGSDRVRF